MPQRIRCQRSKLTDPPPPTPPHHAQRRVEGGEITVHDSAISPHVLREVFLYFPPSPIRGRREYRAPDAPDSRVCVGRKQKAHALVRSHRNHPAFPAQWFTAYIVLSPATGLSCHRRRWNCFHRLDASVGASGPHDFAVRVSAVRQRRRHVHRIPFLTSVTIAKRPSEGTGRPGCNPKI